MKERNPARETRWGWWVYLSHCLLDFFIFFYIPKISSINSIKNLHLKWQTLSQTFPVSCQHFFHFLETSRQRTTAMTHGATGIKRWIAWTSGWSNDAESYEAFHKKKYNTKTIYSIYIYNISYTTVNKMGVSLNGGTPKTSQHDHFLVGKPMVHCWVPPVVGTPPNSPTQKTATDSVPE